LSWKTILRRTIRVMKNMQSSEREREREREIKGPYRTGNPN
jgi:hypothetical protein